MKKEGSNREKYNPAIHHRRSIRLKGYNYSTPGAYFVTICVQEKDNWIFGKVVGGKMQFSHMGELVVTANPKSPKADGVA
jgi:putative transposase